MRTYKLFDRNPLDLTVRLRRKARSLSSCDGECNCCGSDTEVSTQEGSSQFGYFCDETS